MPFVTTIQTGAMAACRSLYTTRLPTPAQMCPTNHQPSSKPKPLPIDPPPPLPLSIPRPPVRLPNQINTHARSLMNCRHHLALAWKRHNGQTKPNRHVVNHAPLAYRSQDGTKAFPFRSVKQAIRTILMRAIIVMMMMVVMVMVEAVAEHARRRTIIGIRSREPMNGAKWGPPTRVRPPTCDGPHQVARINHL